MQEIAPSENRDRQELELRVLLGSAHLALNGWPEPEVERNLSRAHELAKECGESRNLFAILYGRWCVYNTRGIYETSLPLTQEMITSGTDTGDSGLRVMGHAAAAITYTFTTAFDQAEGSLLAVEELYDEGERSKYSTHVFTGLYSKVRAWLKIPGFPLPVLICDVE